MRQLKHFLACSLVVLLVVLAAACGGGSSGGGGEDDNGPVNVAGRWAGTLIINSFSCTLNVTFGINQDGNILSGEYSQAPLPGSVGCVAGNATFTGVLNRTTVTLSFPESRLTMNLSLNQDNTQMTGTYVQTAEDGETIEAEGTLTITKVSD